MTIKKAKPLKPCLFCGGIKWEQCEEYNYDWVAECQECGALVPWSIINNRSEEDQLKAEIERLKAIIEGGKCGECVRMQEIAALTEKGGDDE